MMAFTSRELSPDLSLFPADRVNRYGGFLFTLNPVLHWYMRMNGVPMSGETRLQRPAGGYLGPTVFLNRFRH